MNNQHDNLEMQEIERSELLRLYNIIDWIDFGLVIAIVAYVSNAARDAESLFELPPSVVGLLLCVVSLCVSVSAVIVSRLIHKKGANRSRIRLIVRYIVWGVWIPVDIYFIFVYAAGLLSA